jgi:hypothetical protein
MPISPAQGHSHVAQTYRRVVPKRREVVLQCGREDGPVSGRRESPCCFRKNNRKAARAQRLQFAKDEETAGGSHRRVQEPGRFSAFRVTAGSPKAIRRVTTSGETSGLSFAVLREPATGGPFPQSSMAEQSARPAPARRPSLRWTEAAAWAWAQAAPGGACQR